MSTHACCGPRSIAETSLAVPVAMKGDGVPDIDDVLLVVPDIHIAGANDDVISKDACKDGDGVPGVCARIGQSILQNCERVKRLNQYIGLFEWALFAYFFAVNVVIHLVTESINPIEFLVPSLLASHRIRVQNAGEREDLHVAWCKVGKNGKLLLSRERCHEVNHFVVLIRIAEVTEGVPCSDFPDGDDLMTWAENNGYMVMKTVSQGDCGVDCMAAYLGMQRRGSTWFALRQKLHACAQRVCGRAAWIAAFQMAGEGGVHLDDVIVKERSKNHMFRSKYGLNKTFMKWAANSSSKWKPTQTSKKGCVAGDVVPADGAAGDVVPVMSEPGDASAAEEDLDAALRWCLGVGSASVRAPWQFEV